MILFNTVKLNRGQITRFNLANLVKNVYKPASSKWPFDNPNGGHLTPEKVT